MSQPNGPELEKLVAAVTAEVMRRLGTEFQLQSARTPNDRPCTGCGLCVQKCRKDVETMVEAGASRIAAAPGVTDVPKTLARFIDHTNLKQDATPADIEQLCAEARQHGFAAVCVNPLHVKLAARLLRGSGVITCSVVGFPLGASATQAKVYETRQAIRDGAREIDMVIDVGALKAGLNDRVKSDIKALVEACRDGGAHLKVIIEAALLNDEEKVRACRLSKEAGAHFVKTSTGFGPGGATSADVALMRQTVGADVGVKAAGGIRTFDDLTHMLAAGATRIGASASVKILKEARAALGA